MRAVFFIFLLAITLAAAVMAWDWRNDRAAAAERVRRALAVRPAPSAAPVVQGQVQAPTPALGPAAIAPLKGKDSEAARAEYYAAMMPESSEARRAKNAKLAELHTKKLRLEFLLKNGAFLRSRNLADADRERLLAAWIAKELDMQDVRVLGREMGLPVGDPAVTAGFEAARQRLHEVETSVLGPDGVVALAEYRQGQPIRDAVMNLQGEAALAGHPLTLEQTDAVAAILANSGSRPGRPVRSLSQVDPATAERLLANVLSPEQRELLLLSLRGSLASSKFNNMVFTIRQRERSGAATP